MEFNSSEMIPKFSNSVEVNATDISKLSTILENSNGPRHLEKSMGRR